MPLNSPSGQIEYEIYLLTSQAESLLNDLDSGKSPSTFRQNISELKKCQALISAIILSTERTKE